MSKLPVKAGLYEQHRLRSMPTQYCRSRQPARARRRAVFRARRPAGRRKRVPPQPPARCQRQDRRASTPSRTRVGKLVDPVSKALSRLLKPRNPRRSASQTVPQQYAQRPMASCATRSAELEKKAAFSEKECQALRQSCTTTQSLLLRTPEATKAEIAIDDCRSAACRSWIWKRDSRRKPERERPFARRIVRLDERLSTADKRGWRL